MLKQHFVDREHKFISCLETSTVQKCAEGLEFVGGFAYYTGDTSELISFEYSLSAPDEITIKATLGGWTRFKNLQGLKEIGRLSEQIKESFEDDNAWVLFDIYSNVLESNIAHNSLFKPKGAAWEWAFYDQEDTLVDCLNYIRENHTIITDIGNEISQSWFNFRYFIVYPALINHMMLMRFSALEYDFWIELARRFPKLYQAAKEIPNWDVHLVTLDALMAAYKL